jgi:hypothetical protein
MSWLTAGARSVYLGRYPGSSIVQTRRMLRPRFLWTLMSRIDKFSAVTLFGRDRS